MSGAKVISDAREAAQELAERVRCAKRVVFFGGAGVSTASGIPDFRSEDGLYHQKFKYPPEEMLSHEFYLTHTEEFFDFYRTRMIALGAKPNQAHYKLAELEREGKLTAVVTQNIDGLHQAAGSKRVYELHGSVHRNVCQRCGHVYSAEWIMGTTGVPHCEECGGRIKPDVVLYGESLDEKTLIGAAEDIQSCDMLIVGGTSLVVYPAAGLVQYFQGDDLVIVNKQPTPQDGAANLVCACDIAKAFDF
ncbi:NAD-dependent protein deacylase [Olsenella sp. AF16-14LB]|jgi:NAD-dependent deacetylase|uniref:NAD-dependent protein deacylase n=1 Tax=Atopobiaceae TaxID=1643824 RepID=UPI000509F9C5|nr:MULTISPECIES: NAD-dependent protein deacylase [unclassified Olsenella]RGJ45777.1 NAD-dependent protein deacylase [Olsenella sp. TM06-36]RGS50927.1 NAD-dependent protein deacylase [Olsenella sp. AF21-51]RGU51067.1 NAD-dependent protein deacylase [Olsenella sp. AF16-14LB]RGU82198.1 NAD-dependent protein deacylase [Olsenella sp. AF15-43LB]RHB55323.1 NAD-dependent protein deacylase [Olsenella sp. AM39-30AC]